MSDFLVEFGCEEAVIRSGLTAADVMDPDPLGCLPVRVLPLTEVRLKGPGWARDGELRVEVEV